MTSSTATLDDFMALNEELAALVAADVPLDLGLGNGHGNPAAQLEGINAAVARRVSRGDTLAQALASEESLPVPYRCVVQLGLRTGQLDYALDGAQRLAQNAEASQYGFRSALAYPLLVCTLAYAGLIGLCLYYVPRLEDMHEGMRISAGLGLRILMSLRASLPFWVAIPPIALVLFLAYVRRSQSLPRHARTRSADVWARLTGQSRAAYLDKLANFSDALATLLEAQTPLAEALPLAACSVGDAGLRQSARDVAFVEQPGHSSGNAFSANAISPFPPFLRWALLHSEPAVPRSRALHMAATVYRESAKRASERARLIAPLIASIFIGGTVTLLYGLAVFAPVVDLLYKLGANPAAR